RKQLYHLFQNGNPGNIGKDHYPMGLLVYPEEEYIHGVWLLSEIREDYTGYGLHIKHYQDALRGEFDLFKLASEIQDGVRLHFDANFVGRFPLSVYEKAANYAEGYADMFWNKEYLVDKFICTKEEVLNFPDIPKMKPDLRPFSMPKIDS